MFSQTIFMVRSLHQNQSHGISYRVQSRYHLNLLSTIISPRIIDLANIWMSFPTYRTSGLSVAC
jgi:hypothetical protein